jgi:glycosyltransferase involved in cell wall biosynthesis
MQVNLFKVFAQEGWHSIDVYGSRLLLGLDKIGSSESDRFTGLCPEWKMFKAPHSARIYFNRIVNYIPYARSKQGEINHILDNSYGHLIHFMDRKKIVVTSHGGTPQTWRRFNREGFSMRFFDWAFTGMLKASRIIIVSEFSKKEITDFYDYDPDRIHVVHHGVHPVFRPYSSEERAKIRNTLGIDADTKLILHVGSCIERKNVDGLLSAISILAKGCETPIRCIQIGGEFTDRQNQIIAEKRLSASIQQIPGLPNEQLVDYYNAADVFAFPSLYEGFGIPLIEAMACGLPIVCSDLSLFREVCRDVSQYAHSGNANDFAEGMANVLFDARKSDAMRQAGLLLSKIYTWENTARGTVEVYKKLINES